LTSCSTSLEVFFVLGALAEAHFQISQTGGQSFSDSFP